MKKLLAVSVIILLTFSVFSQDKETPPIRIGKLGVFFAPAMKFTKAEGSGTLFGLQAGVKFKKKGHDLAVGAAFYTALSSTMICYECRALSKIRYGGAFFEYIFEPEKKVHLSMSLLIGAGKINYSESDIVSRNSLYHHIDETHFIVEPSMNFQVKASRLILIEICAGVLEINKTSDNGGLFLEFRIGFGKN